MVDKFPCSLLVFFEGFSLPLCRHCGRRRPHIRAVFGYNRADTVLFKQVDRRSYSMQTIKSAARRNVTDMLFCAGVLEQQISPMLSLGDPFLY